MKASKLIHRAMPYFKKYKWILIFDLFLAALTTICELVLPLIVRYFTGIALNDMKSLTVHVILGLGLFYLVLRVIDAAANYYMQSVGHMMGAKVETDMRRDLFSHLQKLSFSYYDNVKIGQIMSRITNDLFEVTEFAHHCPEEFFIAGIKITAAFIILSTINVWLTLLIFIFFPIMMIVSSRLSGKMREAFRESRHQIGELNAQVEDSLLGIRVVKSYANEPLEEEKFEGGNQAFLKIKKKMYHAMALFHTSTRLFDGAMYIFVVVAGALFMLYGRIAPADYVAYLLYISTLLNSIRRVVEFMEQFQRGMTGIERFFDIMDTPVEIADLPGAVDIGEVKGEIRFEDVSFRYSDEHQNVLSDIDLLVRPGENVAMVGPSGGGKTTMCSLIARFYEVTAGRILLDGVDIKQLTLQSLRQNIGIVQQDVYLFSGSVMENIAYGRPGAAEDEIRDAAVKASAHDFIMALPEGYHTYVGERGVKLSGGQKQRISIARVFLKNPPILILDEATSALDNENEHIVHQSLQQLAAGRTTFTIAHRLTTIQNAATILVLTENGIEEKGNHEELMRKQGIYFNLYKTYQI